ncbi:MAG: S4 domain-containing protein [Steroidobacteraceae bacterium]
MRERIQKLLAARGVGSRRQVEAWIVAGRITVNGKPASPGQPVDARDDVRLDGRRLRLGREAGEHLGMIYHRPAQEDIRPGADGTTPSSIERLPKSAGRRWIPISPLAANDGGLELFVTDGRLAAALTRRGIAIPAEYSVRVRGVFDDMTIFETLTAATARAGLTGQLTGAVPAGGEGSNRWIQVTATGLRPRDLKQLFDSCGLEANRILRTRFGPVSMDRALARGRSRPLTDEELAALREVANPGRQTTGSRKPAR